MRRLLRFCAWCAAFFLLVGWLAIENLLPYWPIKPYRQNPERASWRLPKGANPETYGLQVEHLTVQTRDSLLLQALLVVPTLSTAPSADAAHSPIAGSETCLIMLPGISSCKEFFLPAAQQFSREGYYVLLLDQRAHGQSGGDYCTFGFQEKHDVSCVVDTLLARHPNMRIGIYGNSLGGAVALQVLAEDKRLQFGIIESTFNTMENVVAQYGENYFGIRSEWLTRHTLDKAAAIAHFDPYAVKPCQSACSITQPIFMAHGDADERIPFAFGRDNFEHLASQDKEWHTVQGAGHNDIWARGGAEYQAAMLAFLGRQK